MTKPIFFRTHLWTARQRAQVNYFCVSFHLKNHNAKIFGRLVLNKSISIYSFCILSSVGYLIELIHNVDDLSEKPKLRLLDPSLTNFIDIVVTDLPMLTLNLLVTACHGMSL